MKFGNQTRSSSLIINMIFEIEDLDPKLKTWADLISKLQCPRFYEIWHSQRIEHASYEYINWN